DPKNEALAGQVATVFKGTTLRGMLLNAYGFWQMGQIMWIGAIVSFAGAALLLILSGAGAVHLRRGPPAAPGVPAVHHPPPAPPRRGGPPDRAPPGGDPPPAAAGGESLFRRDPARKNGLSVRLLPAESPCQSASAGQIARSVRPRRCVMVGMGLMKICVTGSSGRAGRAVVADLVEHGHQVIGVDLVVPGGAGPAEFIRADLTDYGQAVEV